VFRRRTMADRTDNIAIQYYVVISIRFIVSFVRYGTDRVEWDQMLQKTIKQLTSKSVRQTSTAVNADRWA